MPSVVVAAAVVRHEGRILLTRRVEGAHLGGMWEFPGGKVEEGEDPEVAVARECMEECAIAVEVLDILEVTFHRYPTKDILLLFYDCRLRDPAAQVRRGFALALARQPDDAEVAAAVKLVERAGLVQFCRMLLNANEFVYVD